MTSGQLLEKIEKLLEYGVHNLNLVTPGHYADRLPDTFRALSLTRGWQRRPVPVIWNSSAYETADSLLLVAEMVDIYLVDMKFHAPGLAADLASAPDYPRVAYAAIREMVRQQTHPVFDRQGLIQSGVIIRHLVLPGQVEDSFRILEELAEIVPLDTPLSLMKQYTPRPGSPCGRRTEMKRRLFDHEYRQVLEYANEMGFTHLLNQ